jgi:hypothetical protein
MKGLDSPQKGIIDFENTKHHRQVLREQIRP